MIKLLRQKHQHFLHVLFLLLLSLHLNYELHFLLQKPVKSHEICLGYTELQHLSLTAPLNCIYVCIKCLTLQISLESNIYKKNLKKSVHSNFSSLPCSWLPGKQQSDVATFSTGLQIFLVSLLFQLKTKVIKKQKEINTPSQNSWVNQNQQQQQQKQLWNNKKNSSKTTIWGKTTTYNNIKKNQTPSM